MKRTLVFATNNRHKLEEVQAMLGGNFALLSLKDIGCEADIPETGDTFRENASLKSRYVHGQFGMDCFSDDSGLEVDALGGRPGIYSARYAGKHGDDRANIEKLLRDLEGQTDRRARFRAVISLILDGKEYFFEGVTEGRIRREQSGAGGFGYDPVFEPGGYPVTFAEMSPEQKNGISHRGKAIEKLAAFLAEAGPAGPIRTGGQNAPGTGI